MEIRKATAQDCNALTLLRIKMREEREKDKSINQTYFYDLTYQYFLDKISKGEFVAFIAIYQNKVVATSGICFYTVPPTYGNLNGKVAYVMNMYTLPEYRKRGIANELLCNIMEEAKANQCTVVTLNASEMGKPIYQKYGFIEIENHMEYVLSN